MNRVFTPLLRLANAVLRIPGSVILPALLSALLVFPALVVAAVTQPAVGEVRLFIGEAYIVGADGKATAVGVGAPVRVTDTIETGSGGFVHIRFVDNQLVTVRPYSMLQVSSFEYDAQTPQNSSIKFRQTEGITRFISGEGAKNAKQNFRLNTPIAAIGVRGTDFVVSVSDNAMRALVNEGAIVVAPYSALCSADSFGPCSQDAVELSSLSRQILEMNSTTASTTVTALLPENPTQAPQQLADTAVASTPAPVTGKEKTEKSDVYTDTVTSRAVNVSLASSTAIKPVLPPREYTPDTAVNTASLTSSNSQLVWGRWQETNLAYERITVPYDIAANGDRVVGPGNYPAHLLFRTENGPKVMPQGLGVLKFDLAQAQAHYSTTGTGVALMDVLGGNLQLDFTQNRFATDLQLSHAATGKIEFREDGLINSGGYFNAVRSDQVMAGAVSLDGREAGYYFEKTLEIGSIEGLTLWGQKP